MTNGLDRRAFLRRLSMAPLCIAPLGFSGLTAASHAEPVADFSAFLEDLWPQAEARGVRRETFNEVVNGLSLDVSVPGSAAAQPEFDRPLSAYVVQAVSPQRVARGRQEAARWRNEGLAISQRYEVPAEICIAAWGMETDFGRDLGRKDVIQTLASLAYRRSDRALFADEFVAALVILEKGVPRSALKGSWAGAMGNPQFLPSAYLKYAVAFGGSGAPDIWTSVPDSLASIAHFLRESGWQPGLPWGMEVALPAGFDFPALRMTFSDWARLNLRATRQAAFPAHFFRGGVGEATLFLPSGAGGPAFLLSENYWILKAYNNSDSYALSLALLADAVSGMGELEAAWPAHEKILSRSEKAEMQRLLIASGFYSGTVDGRFGPASRDAIHRFQKTAGVRPADGYGSLNVLQALRSWKWTR